MAHHGLSLTVLSKSVRATKVIRTVLPVSHIYVDSVGDLGAFIVVYLCLMQEQPFSFIFAPVACNITRYAGRQSFLHESRCSREAACRAFRGVRHSRVSAWSMWHNSAIDVMETSYLQEPVNRRLLSRFCGEKRCARAVERNATGSRGTERAMLSLINKKATGYKL